jgi:hypothetical protein
MFDALCPIHSVNTAKVNQPFWLILYSLFVRDARRFSSISLSVSSVYARCKSLKLDCLSLNFQWIDTYSLHISMTNLQQLLQEIREAAFVPWSRVEKAIRACLLTNDAAVSMHLILTEIERHHQQDIQRVKHLIEARARHYDSVVARLQYLEGHCDNKNEEEDSQQTDSAETSDTQTSDWGEDDWEVGSKVFSFNSSESLLRLQVSRPVSIHCTFKEGEADQPIDAVQAKKQKIEELKAQVAEYLSAGVAWKAKAEDVQVQLSELSRRHASAAARIYDEYKATMNKK